MKKKKKKKTTNNKTGASTLKNLPISVLFGDIFTSKLFNRYKFSIFVIVALMMFYITIKYECQTRMETIAKLQIELNIVKSESIRERSVYSSRTRESHMTHLVDSMRLGLKIQDQPPTTLKYHEE